MKSIEDLFAAEASLRDAAYAYACDYANATGQRISRENLNAHRKALRIAAVRYAQLAAEFESGKP